MCGAGPWFSVSFICIRLGVPLYAMRFFDGAPNLNRVLSKVQEFGITLIYTLKSQTLYDIAYQPEANAYNYDLSTLRLVCTRGQPIPRDTLVRAGASLQATMVNFFASTETGVVLAHFSTKSPYYGIYEHIQGLLTIPSSLIRSSTSPYYIHMTMENRKNGHVCTCKIGN